MPRSKSKEETFKVTKDALENLPILSSAVTPKSQQLWNILQQTGLLESGSPFCKLGIAVVMTYPNEVELVKNASVNMDMAQKMAIISSDYKPKESQGDIHHENDKIQKEINGK